MGKVNEGVMRTTSTGYQLGRQCTHLYISWAVCFSTVKSRMLAPLKLGQLHACAVMPLRLHTGCRISIAQGHKPCNNADVTIKSIQICVTFTTVLGLRSQVHNLSICRCPTCLVTFVTGMASLKVSGWFATYAAVLVCSTLESAWALKLCIITWQHTWSRGLLCKASAEACIVCHTTFVFELYSTYMIHLEISWCQTVIGQGLSIKRANDTEKHVFVYVI